MFNKTITRKAVITLIAIVLALVPTYEAFAAPDSVVASVNGVKLSQFQFEQVLNQRVLPMSSFHGNISDEVKAQKTKEAMDILFDEELLYQEAERLGLKAGKKEAAKEVKAAIKRLGGKEKFEEALKVYGMSMDDYKRFLRKSFMVSAVIKSEVDDKSVIKDAEVMDYYEKNKDSHFKVKRKHFSAILIKADPAYPDSWVTMKKKAEEALGRINDGEEFELIAEEFSDDPSREKGGDIGLLGRAQFPLEMADKIWDMKPGQVTEVMRSMYGYHIVKLEADPPAEVMPYDEVADNVKKTLASMKKERLRSALMDRLKSDAKIEVFEVAK